jgi:methyl-accepting chemotaxis protein
MDQVTQQNAALVEEAAAAAESMKDQAGSLDRTVSVFRLDASAEAAKPKPGKPAAAPKEPAPRRAAKLKAVAGGGSRVPVALPANEGWEEF